MYIIPKYPHPLGAVIIFDYMRGGWIKNRTLSAKFFILIHSCFTFISPFHWKKSLKNVIGNKLLSKRWFFEKIYTPVIVWTPAGFKLFYFILNQCSNISIKSGNDQIWKTLIWKVYYIWIQTALERCIVYKTGLTLPN